MVIFSLFSLSSCLACTRSALNVITYLGCIVSIAALVFSLVVLAVSRFVNYLCCSHTFT